MWLQVTHVTEKLTEFSIAIPHFAHCASCSISTFFIVVYRPPCKVQSHLHPQSRKLSSKRLEAMFEGTQSATAVSDQGTIQTGKCCSVQSKQLSSTPVDHNANEFRYPPVSSC